MDTELLKSWATIIGYTCGPIAVIVAALLNRRSEKQKLALEREKFEFDKQQKLAASSTSQPSNIVSIKRKRR